MDVRSNYGDQQHFFEPVHEYVQKVGCVNTPVNGECLTFYEPASQRTAVFSLLGLHQTSKPVIVIGLNTWKGRNAVILSMLLNNKFSQWRCLCLLKDENYNSVLQFNSIWLPHFLVIAHTLHTSLDNSSLCSFNMCSGFWSTSSRCEREAFCAPWSKCVCVIEKAIIW